MLKELTVHLDGKRPLLMESSRSVDPLDPVQKQISAIDKKRKKTEAEIRAADDLRWLMNVYFDDEGYPFIPPDNFLACLTASAKHDRLGQAVKAGVMVNDGTRLCFEGDGKTVEELVKDERFAHRAATKRGVIAHRPIFKNWSCSFDVAYDDTLISDDDFMRIIERSGMVGIGAWRAKFGKFTTKVEMKS